MSTRIQQNVLSLNAQRNIWSAQNDLDQAVTRLSSGLRINQAWEDVGAIGISERFRAQIASLAEAERNAQYSMNMIHTADGALSVIDEKLTKMRSLAIAASNGALTEVDRVALNRTFIQLRSEIDRIASSTNYNGKHILDGSWSAENPNGIKFHIGTYNVYESDYYYVKMDDARVSALGIADVDLLDTLSAQRAIDTIDNAIDLKDTMRTRLGSYVNRLRNTILSNMISRESATASESQIRDADIAEEMSNFVRSQILMQSGVSMLAQANMVPQIVASMIG